MADHGISDPGPMPVALAQVLGANRDGSDAVDSSRALLITVMGEFVLPAGGRVWTQTVIVLMESLGVRAKATRQMLARLEAQGWLERERIGRRTRWALSDPFARLLERGAERIYRFGVDRRRWDGRWVVVVTEVTEGDRRTRNRLTVGLSWAGFGLLLPSLWISPHADREIDAVDLLDHLGIDGVTFRAELGRRGSATELAGRAWSLVELADRYDRFIATVTSARAKSVVRLDPAEPMSPTDSRSDSQSNSRSGADAATELALLVHQWRRFPLLDPDLPSELLPQGWPGLSAAALFTERRHELLAAARSWWHDLEAEFGSGSGSDR